MSELRQNIFNNEWVVIAPTRSKRPKDFVSKNKETQKSKKKDCVFCVSSPEYKKSLKDFESENIYIIPNKFPAFTEELDNCAPQEKLVESFFTYAKALGGHDVIIIKNHDISLPNFTPQIWTELLIAIKKRILYFYGICNATSVLPIYNYLQLSGASIYHPHAQIFAENFIPTNIEKEIQVAKSYYKNKGECVGCELAKHETKQKKRVIAQSKNFISFVAYAGRFPFETWVMPRVHLSNFEKTHNELLSELAEIMQKTVQKISKALENPPLNFFIHTLPKTTKGEKYYHWHLEITPRLGSLGGYELGSGSIINSVIPEQAAKILNKEAL